MRILLAVSWFIVAIYSTIPAFWLLVHPFAARWRKMRLSPYRALLPIWIAMWIAAAAITWPWREIQIYEGTASTWIAGAVLLAISIPIYRRANRSFGRPNLIGQSELRPAEFEQQLVTTGLHARMRHPIYLAHLCTISAFTIGSGLFVNYCLLAFAVVTGAVMIRMEERELEDRFGDQWREYKQRVGILPGITKRVWHRACPERRRERRSRMGPRLWTDGSATNNPTDETAMQHESRGR